MVLIKQEALKGITSCTRYKNGNIRDCALNSYNLISTEIGALIPRYARPGIRSKDNNALSFYENGSLKSVSLNDQTMILTPFGFFPAELLTFYEDGSIESIFPLNGQIGFSWSEEEEGELSRKFEFSFPFGEFNTKIIGLRFYNNGNLRSLILWPGEVITIRTPVGEMEVRIGFRLYENGNIASVEPAHPTKINTSAGVVIAYDSIAIGMDADVNSLNFDLAGNINSLTTHGNIFAHGKNNNNRFIISSTFIPLKLFFEDNALLVREEQKESLFPLADYSLAFYYDDSSVANSCYGDCSGCDACT